MVNIYKVELTLLQQEILSVLFVKSGLSLNQRRISKLLEVSPTAVMKALPDLEKQDLIKIKQDKESKRWSIELNRDNYKAMQLKRVDNLKKIYVSGLVDFLEKEFAGAVIIIFGSYSRGEDTINSDIDISVIGRKAKEIDLEKFDKMLERKIRINFYESFKNIHKNLKDNILNGIVLVGGIEL
ncbi:MAG: nucleotidyltransferase domain-containing protein [Nanoarchaeota archaeon]